MGSSQSAVDRADSYYFHALARALHRGIGIGIPGDSQHQKGINRRPGLPTELILYIFRLAGVINRAPSPQSSFKWAYQVPRGLADVILGTLHRADCRWVFGSSGALERSLLFETPSLDRAMLMKMGQIRLTTLSKDQGWCSNPRDGSWSWFEVGILAPPPPQDASESPAKAIPEDEIDFLEGPEAPIREPKINPSTGVPLLWKSHHNELAVKAFKDHVGILFDPDHELWIVLSLGIILGCGCALSSLVGRVTPRQLKLRYGNGLFQFCCSA